jgi:N-acetylmuramoyl-L-alanine amidase
MTARLSLVIVAVVGVTWVAPAIASAQTARTRYETALARGAAIKQELHAGDGATPALATQARSVIAAYEALVRRYPISGYSDNALFNAAELAAASYERFGQPQDLTAAIRLYRRVGTEYPASSLTKPATAALARLDPAASTVNTAAAPAAPVGPVAPTVSSPPSAAASSGTGEPLPSAMPPKARLTSIDRAVLPDGVRVTIALDKEVPYHEETLVGPARVFFDLRGVEAAAPLADAVLRFPTDVVRQIRVGRHPNATVRVVLDLDGVKRHSVYTLYNPFRLVIDAEPLAPTTARLNPPPVPLSESPVIPTHLPVPAASTTPAPPAPAPLPAVPPVTAAPVPSRSTAAAPAAVAPSLTPLPASRAPEAPVANGAGGFSLSRQLGLGISRIVIDPGHGGHDPGAQARGLNEADLTLDIALRLEKLFQDEAGMEVVLTRRSNEYIGLEERTAIANREGADLFLSIHANTSRSSSASGVETYFLSFAATPDAEAVAARENSAHGGEMHKLPDMIRAITLNNKLDESRDLAGMVQESLVARLRRSNKSVVNRGVKKAPFVVLIGAEMPSVLAEVSFLTNRQEQSLLKTSTYKQRIAEALHAAVMRYRRSLKGSAAIALQ